jgi:hypothetical protein
VQAVEQTLRTAAEVDAYLTAVPRALDACRAAAQGHRAEASRLQGAASACSDGADTVVEAEAQAEKAEADAAAMAEWAARESSRIRLAYEGAAEVLDDPDLAALVTERAAAREAARFYEERARVLNVVAGTAGVAHLQGTAPGQR